MKAHNQTVRDWLIPIAFLICASWVVWHLPAYILTLYPHESESLLAQVSEIHQRKDVSNLPGVFGGVADIIDWVMLALLPIVFWFGTQNISIANMEFQQWRAIDRIALFIGRVTMLLILIMTLVMLYEVLLRYVFEAPTLWANELTLWIAGFVFLLSGVYAMQQRCHIRIFILYDLAPRWLQKTCDIIWTFLLVLFTFFFIYGSYKQVFIVKFYNWEMFGTAFDPPIPATVQPMILITMALLSAQAVVNLISDWNLEPAKHSAADDIDQDELDAIKKTLEAE